MRGTTTFFTLSLPILSLASGFHDHGRRHSRRQENSRACSISSLTPSNGNSAFSALVGRLGGGVNSLKKRTIFEGSPAEVAAVQSSEFMTSAAEACLEEAMLDMMVRDGEIHPAVIACYSLGYVDTRLNKFGGYLSVFRLGSPEEHFSPSRSSPNFQLSLAYTGARDPLDGDFVDTTLVEALDISRPSVVRPSPSHRINPGNPQFTGDCHGTDMTLLESFHFNKPSPKVGMQRRDGGLNLVDMAPSAIRLDGRGFGDVDLRYYDLSERSLKHEAFGEAAWGLFARDVLPIHDAPARSRLSRSPKLASRGSSAFGGLTAVFSSNSGGGSSNQIGGVTQVAAQSSNSFNGASGNSAQLNGDSSCVVGGLSANPFFTGGQTNGNNNANNNAANGTANAGTANNPTGGSAQMVGSGTVANPSLQNPAPPAPPANNGNNAPPASASSTPAATATPAAQNNPPAAAPANNTTPNPAPNNNNNNAAANGAAPAPSSPSSSSDPNAIAAVATPAGVAAADSAQTSVFQLPGRTLMVLPIGLGVFAGISVIALIIVGIVTYERRKYRTQFRARKVKEQAGGFGKQG